MLNIGGAVSTQISIANGHLGEKGQPVGGFIKSGGEPSIGTSLSLPCLVNFGIKYIDQKNGINKHDSMVVNLADTLVNIDLFEESIEDAIYYSEVNDSVRWTTFDVNNNGFGDIYEKTRRENKNIRDVTRR